MYNRLVFFNAFGSGDIYESRKFVKELSERIPAESYYYAHGRDPKILKDVDFLGFTEFTDVLNSMLPYQKIDNDLFINTWIGRNSKYVLPGIGCTVEKLYEMYNETLSQIGIQPLVKTPLDYIPKIDYSAYEIDKVKTFLEGMKEMPLVLISNGSVHSCQAENFPLDPSIKLLSEKHKDHNLILTQRMSDLKARNIFYTEEIMYPHEGTDLNEIAYLSQYCRVIIGRNSGPQVFAQNMDNWLDETKTCLSFTYKKVASHFVLSDELPMRKMWSPSTEVNEVFNVMSEAVET